MLEYSHNPSLILLSLAIAMMSGFTGLSLTQGASKMPLGRRKLMIAMSAVSLGGGIWSMHFVAMLGLQLPLAYYYDGLTTLTSALVAILLTGMALLVVHFGERTPLRITLAGVLVGIGIPIMHYLGMSGMQICRPIYSVFGVGTSVASSLVLCIASFWLCYGERRPQNIVLGTLGFGLSVFSVHFIAMYGTGFTKAAGADLTMLGLSNEVLAFFVSLASFAIAGAFLLTGVTFQVREGALTTTTQEAVETQAASVSPTMDTSHDDSADMASSSHLRIPYEQGGRTYFVQAEDVAAIRAEGRYTFLYRGDDKLFCPWSITEAEERLQNSGFCRCHRGYIVNASHVSSFERKKDTGVCYFDGTGAIEKAPVSRSHLASVRESLGF
jgi:NO-binding membrane sensor protein with MHYT domain